MGGQGGHPPGPVKIDHKKDGRQRWLHRFHVSRPPLPGRWIRYWIATPFCSSTNESSEFGAYRLFGNCMWCGGLSQGERVGISGPMSRVGIHVHPFPWYTHPNPHWYTHFTHLRYTCPQSSVRYSTSPLNSPSPQNGPRTRPRRELGPGLHTQPIPSTIDRMTDTSENIVGGGG